MNLIDYILQDKEEAKAELASVLNQKAFDFLDAYNSASEVEVMTFEDDESEDLTEGTGTDYGSHYNAGRDAALDGKKASTCPHKKDNVNAVLQRKAWLMGHKDYKLKESVDDESSEYEGLGTLAGLSKHVIKAITKDPYSGRMAGQDSEVETHHVKSKSGHLAALNKAIDAGHVPVVYVNGKIHAAAQSTGSSYGRTEYHVHDADSQKEKSETKYPKPYRSGGRMYYPSAQTHTNPRYNKGEALSVLTPGHDSSFYKENKVEVKVIHSDKVRQKKMRDRASNRPVTQSNYVNTVKGDKKSSSYIDGKTKTSVTPAGDMKAIKDAAALKLATKKLGGDSVSANKKAMDLHTELGKHLAAGKHKEAIRTANALADHVRNQGLSTHADKIKDYADTLQDLKKSWGDKEYAHKKLAKMRGETNESEVIESLESMITEMLDVNEAVVKDSVKKDKDGNVLSFKTVGDKNAEKEYDDSVKKDLDSRKKWNSDFGIKEDSSTK